MFHAIHGVADRQLNCTLTCVLNEHIDYAINMSTHSAVSMRTLWRGYINSGSVPHKKMPSNHVSTSSIDDLSRLPSSIINKIRAIQPSRRVDIFLVIFCNQTAMLIQFHIINQSPSHFHRPIFHGYFYFTHASKAHMT